MWAKTGDMQMLLITHADKQNAHICFTAKPTVISSRMNVEKESLRVNVET